MQRQTEAELNETVRELQQRCALLEREGAHLAGFASDAAICSLTCFAPYPLICMHVQLTHTGLTGSACSAIIQRN